MVDSIRSQWVNGGAGGSWWAEILGHITNFDEIARQKTDLVYWQALWEAFENHGYQYPQASRKSYEGPGPDFETGYWLTSFAYQQGVGGELGGIIDKFGNRYVLLGVQVGIPKGWGVKSVAGVVKKGTTESELEAMIQETTYLTINGGYNGLNVNLVGSTEAGGSTQNLSVSIVTKAVRLYDAKNGNFGQGQKAACYVCTPEKQPNQIFINN